MPAKLQCNNCGNEFQERARFLSIESSDQGTVGWAPERDATRGIRCPACGSDLLRVVSY
jgi:DNA-directed RNA polymerase subunit RPC12/RpoP